MVRQFALLVAVSILTGCGTTEPDWCSPILRYGLTVQVLDSITSVPVADSATMTLQDGTYIETVTSSNDGRELIGAWERPGDYTVSVSRSGYHDWVETNVRVTADECHVIPVRLTARMVATP